MSESQGSVIAAVEPLRREPVALTKREIDRRIDEILASVAGLSHPLLEAPKGSVRPLPRWISAAEIARRVRPVLSLN